MYVIILVFLVLWWRFKCFKVLFIYFLMSNDIFFLYLIRPKYREKEQYFKSKSMIMQTGIIFIEILSQFVVWPFSNFVWQFRIVYGYCFFIFCTCLGFINCDSIGYFIDSVMFLGFVYVPLCFGIFKTVYAKIKIYWNSGWFSG